MKDSNNNTMDSQKLSYLLRHDKTYTFETGGWRSVADLVSKDLSFEKLCTLVDNDSNGRFELNDDKTKIRALYGHSVPVNMNYVCCTPPEILYHGTSGNAEISILEDGLKPRARNYVHLTNSYDSAIETGARHGVPVVSEIKAFEMFKEGYKFYNPTGKIWLVSEVPSRFLSFSYIPIEYDVKRKAINVTCDSNNVCEKVKQDSTISSLCDITHFTNMPLSIHTLEDMLFNQLHFIVVTDINMINNDFIEHVLSKKEYTRGVVLISPIIVDNIPSIQAMNYDDIHDTLHFLFLLIYNRTVQLNFRDITELLFASGGEIKVFQTMNYNNSDITSLCKKIATTLKGINSNFKNCIVGIMIPDYDDKHLHFFINQYEQIEEFICNLIPDIKCYFYYLDLNNIPDDIESYMFVCLH